MKKTYPIMLAALMFIISACSPKAEPDTLTVMTHDSFSISEDVVAAFEDMYGVEVRFLKLGDAGSALNKAILSMDAPLADVFYGVDNTFLSRALEEGVFEPYESPMLASIPAEFLLDDEFRVVPIDYGDVCLNIDLDYFAEQGLEAPSSLDDLLDPAYAGLLVVENPATSSPGMAFLLATIGHFGESHYLEYWRALVENDVLIVNDWETAYYAEFSRWGGTRPIVVSYGSSPPFEMIYAEEPMQSPATAAITADDTCYRQIEFAGILTGTTHRELAEAWIDFMLSPAFQEDLPMQIFMFPVNPDAQLDETFVEFLAIPEQPVVVSSEAIVDNREAWLEAWRGVVLQ